MSPTIFDSDILLIDTAQREFKVGDIVAYYGEDGKIVAHTILDIIGSRYVILKGDNNIYPDKPIRYERIVGKIRGIERKNETK